MTRAILRTAMQVDLEHPSAEILERAALIIRQGGVVLHPSDTVYGLACDPFQPRPVERVLELKGREQSRGMLVLIPDLSHLTRLVPQLPEPFHELRAQLWPGPVSFLLPARADLPPVTVGPEGQVGIRLPQQRFLRRWMEEIPGPLLSTSANRSGEPPVTDVRQAREIFGDQLDLILEGPIREGALPSSIVDLTGPQPRLVRRGRWAPRVEALLERRRGSAGG